MVGKVSELEHWEYGISKLRGMLLNFIAIHPIVIQIIISLWIKVVTDWRTGTTKTGSIVKLDNISDQAFHNSLFDIIRSHWPQSQSC